MDSVESVESAPGPSVDRRGPMTRRSFQISGLAAIVLAGNGPFIGGYAAGQYQNWRSHQPGYERRHGRWDVVGNSHTNTIHGVLLNTGKVLLCAGSGNNQKYFDEKIYRTVLWDPARNTFRQVYTQCHVA